MIGISKSARRARTETAMRRDATAIKKQGFPRRHTTDEDDRVRQHNRARVRDRLARLPVGDAEFKRKDRFARSARSLRRR